MGTKRSAWLHCGKVLSPLAARGGTLYDQPMIRCNSFGLAAMLAMVITVSHASPALSDATSDTFGELVRQASAAKNKGDLSETARLLREAIAIRPLPELRNNLGKILEQMGDYRGAVESYSKVANDPKASPNLRSLDAARIATLQSKLRSGWVLARVVPAGASILVDGRPPAAPPGEEFPVPPGSSTLEFTTADGKTGAIFAMAYPLGKRTTMVVSLTGLPGKLITNEADSSLAAAGGFGAVNLGDIVPKPASLSVDGYTLRNAAALEQLWLPAGKRLLKLTFAKDRTIGVTVTVKEGAKMSVASLAKAALQHLAQAKTAPAPAVEEATLSPWPFVLIGVGVLATGVGAFLMVDAGSDIDSLDEATRDSRGVITSLTAAEAQSIKSLAESNAAIGGAMAGIGGALALGGIVWSVVEATSGPETRGVVDVSLGWGSVRVGGKF